MKSILLILFLLVFSVNSYIFTPKFVVRSRIQCNKNDEIIDLNDQADPQRAEQVQAQIQAKIDAAEAAGENDFINFLKMQFEKLCDENGNNDTISFEVFVSWKEKMGLYLDQEELTSIWEHVMSDHSNGCDFIAFKEVNRLVDEAF